MSEAEILSLLRELRNEIQSIKRDLDQVQSDVRWIRHYSPLAR